MAAAARHVRGPVTLTEAVGAQVGEPRLRALVVLTSKDPNAKATVLLFVPGDLGALGATVPLVLRELEIQGRTCLLTTGVEGSPMLGTYHRWRHTAAPASVRADFEAAGSWLETFQRCTAGPTQPLDLGRSLVGCLRLRFAGDEAAVEALRRLERIHALLGRARAPRTAVHGDFWAGNLLVGGGAVTGVVDWESGSTSGEPVRDLVRFAVTYALYLDRHAAPGGRVAGHPKLRTGRWGAGVAYAIAAQGWFPDLFRHFLRQGLRRLGVPSNLWRPAVLAGLAEIAATADHEGFGRRHFELFSALAGAR